MITKIHDFPNQAHAESTIYISNLEDVRKIDKRLNSIRRTNMLSIFSDRVVSDQSEQIVVGSTRRSCVSNPFECIELSERCSRDERNFLLSHSPSIVTPHMSIADSRFSRRQNQFAGYPSLCT